MGGCWSKLPRTVNIGHRRAAASARPTAHVIDKGRATVSDFLSWLLLLFRKPVEDKARNPLTRRRVHIG